MLVYQNYIHKKIYKIGIVIPTYNSEKYLSTCLESISKQKNKNFICYIFDNNSTDNTVKIAKKFTNINIKIYQKEDKSALDAINYNILSIEEKYILYLGSDDWIDLNTIDILNITLEKSNFDLIRYEVDFFKNNINIGKIKIYKKNELTLENALFGPTINYLIKRDLFIKYGKYKTDIWHNCADREFLIRLSLQKVTLIEINQVLYHFRKHPNSSTNSDNSFKNIKITSTEILLAEEYLKNAKNSIEKKLFMKQIYKLQIAYLYYYYLNEGLFKTILITLKNPKRTLFSLFNYFTLIRDLKKYKLIKE